MTKSSETVMEIQVNPIEDKVIDMYHEVKDTRSAIYIFQKQIREILEADDKYISNKNQLAAINKKQKAKKEELMHNPKIIDLERQIKELKKSLKDEQLTLFGHLDEFTKTGADVIKIDGKFKKLEKLYKVKKV